MLVFTDEWVGEVKARYERLPTYSRPIIYHIAVNDNYEYFRNEIEDYIQLVPEEASDVLVSRLRSEDHIFQTHRELAVGALVMQDFSASLIYEREYMIDSSTMSPDWTILNEFNKPVCVIEVVTDNPSNDVLSRDRQVGYFQARLQEIELGVILSVGGKFDDLDQQRSKRLVSGINCWLNKHPPAGSTEEFEEINITVYQWAERFPRVQFVGPTDSWFVDPVPLREKILEKAKKYRPLAQDGLPLVIAVYSAFRTGRDFDDLQEALFGESGLFADTDFLSGVMWLYRQDGMRLHFIENPNTYLPAPELLCNDKSDYSYDLRLLGKSLILKDADAIRQYDEQMGFFRGNVLIIL